MECTGSEVSYVSDVVDVRLSYMGCTGWVWVGVIVGGGPRIVGIAED